MIGVDTNVLVRLLVADDARQFEAAQRVFAAAREDEPLFIPLLVIAETGWVLRARYKLKPAEIAASLAAVTALPGVRVEQPLLVRAALEAAAKRGGDLADHLIAAVALASGCDQVVTFDQMASEAVDGMRALAD